MVMVSMRNIPLHSTQGLSAYLYRTYYTLNPNP